MTPKKTTKYIYVEKRNDKHAYRRVKKKDEHVAIFKEPGSKHLCNVTFSSGVSNDIFNCMRGSLDDENTPLMLWLGWVFVNAERIQK